MDNTDYVKAGEPLVQLDDSDEILALDKAKTALANIVRQNASSKSSMVSQYH